MSYQSFLAKGSVLREGNKEGSEVRPGARLASPGARHLRLLLATLLALGNALVLADSHGVPSPKCLSDVQEQKRASGGGPGACVGPLRAAAAADDWAAMGVRPRAAGEEPNESESFVIMSIQTARNAAACTSRPPAHPLCRLCIGIAPRGRGLRRSAASLYRKRITVAARGLHRAAPSAPGAVHSPSHAIPAGQQAQDPGCAPRAPLQLHRGIGDARASSCGTAGHGGRGGEGLRAGDARR